MWPFDNAKRAEKLLARAEEAFERHEHDLVLRTAEKLLAMRHTAGFEWKARALSRLGKRSEAIAVLEEGVRVAPQVPALWSHLGEQRSDAKDFDGARAAFARLESFGRPWTEAAVANDALVMWRDGRYADAILRLETIDDPGDAGLRQFVAGIRVDSLFGAGRLDEAVQVAEQAIAWMAASPEQDSPSWSEGRARIRVTLAHASWQRDRCAPEAIARCLEAVADGARGEVFDLIREIEAHDATRARPFRLMCEGRARIAVVGGDDPHAAEPKLRGFLCTYDVLADDPADGLAFVRRVEEQLLGDRLVSLEVSKVLEVEKSVSGGKGVYWGMGGHTWFDLDD